VRRLEIAVTPGDPVQIVMTGRIDDTAGLGALVETIPPGPITIDTHAVTFVNSYGMRDWIRFLRALRDRGVPTLTRVADVLVTQMNLLSEVRGTLKIASFYAPFACNGCGFETHSLIDAHVHAVELAAMRAPRVPCDECGSPMELADFPERYLSIFQQ